MRKDPEIFSKRHFGGGSVKVWDGFGSNGKTELALITTRTKSADYILMLKSKLLPSGSKIGGKNEIFQQDNASIHTSRQTKHWLANNLIKYFDWPAKSPDLNPIENIWGILARRVYTNGKQYYSVSDIKEAIFSAWNSIEPEICQYLVDSMSNRLFEITRKNGGSIDY